MRNSTPDRLWALVKKHLTRAKANGMSVSRIAEVCDVSIPAIYKYMNDAIGGGSVELESAWKLIDGLKIPEEEVVEAIAPGDFARIKRLKEKYPDIFEQLDFVLCGEGEDESAEKILSDLRWMASRK